MNGYCRPNGCLNVISLWLFTEVHIYWVHSSRNVQPRRSLEVLLELDGIHCRRHDDQLEVRPPCNNLLYQPE